MAVALVRVSIVVIKHYDQKENWGGKGLFDLHFHTTVHQQRKSGQGLKQGWNLEAGADAETVEWYAYWLAPHGLFNRLSYRTQDHQLRDSTTHHGLGPPHL